MKNILEFNALFEQIGIGLNKDEIYWYEKKRILFENFCRNFFIRKDMAFNEKFT